MILSQRSQALMERRLRLLGPNVSTFYEEPVHFVRGEDVWLWDDEGRKYLDCYNNVPHVGHCNPRVIKALTQQAATLNTHTRYLHDGILDYIERLTGTLDESLDAAIMTCTGSEANDVALRMAQAVTGKTGVIATDATYHGNTSAVAPLSINLKPKFGIGSHIRWVEAPDSYRAPDPDGADFAAKVKAKIDELAASEAGFSALIICPYFVNEGFPDLPDNWLQKTANVVREAGGLLIADEVQPGFGRLGPDFWGHKIMGVVPDILTLGKPMANGHPVGAVVARYDVLAAFRQAFRYFNTFGGNPVSCAAAMAVLDELEDRDLPAHAANLGKEARERLDDLAKWFDFIGDCRGKGMLFGAEFVLDHDAKTPATEFTSRVVNAMRQEGIILSSLGRHKNTLKIRPPLTFQSSHMDLLFDKLTAVLDSTPLKT